MFLQEILHLFKKKNYEILNNLFFLYLIHVIF
jgi:hypothetical protein